MSIHDRIPLRHLSKCLTQNMELKDSKTHKDCSWTWQVYAADRASIICDARSQSFGASICLMQTYAAARKGMAVNLQAANPCEGLQLAHPSLGPASVSAEQRVHAFRASHPVVACCALPFSLPQSSDSSTPAPSITQLDGNVALAEQTKTTCDISRCEGNLSVPAVTHVVKPKPRTLSHKTCTPNTKPHAEQHVDTQ